MQFACPIFGGLGGVFTDGGTQQIEKLIDDLPPEAGADHWRHTEWQKAADQIIARRDKFGPIAVCAVGMSYGVDGLVRLARRLDLHGIAIQYMAAIDPTALPRGATPMWVSDNVMEVDEFWSTAPFFNFPLAARKRSPGGMAGGMLVYNPGFRGVRNPIYRIPGGHLNTAASPITHKRIVAKVAAILETID